MSEEMVGRAGEKLGFAIKKFGVEINGLVCADFGSNVGGFVQVMLNEGAKRVYSVETGYGVLDWKLRNNEKVVVMERTNAMHVRLPEKVDFISIDVSWTPQVKILPNAVDNLKENGQIISLIKPHYEATSRFIKLNKGKLDESQIDEVLKKVRVDIESLGLKVIDTVKSPILGGKAGNVEYLFWIKRS